MGLFFKNVKIANYRMFSHLELRDLQQINLFGGRNGTGKSTLLEALFTVVDISNPEAPLRPFGFRRLEANSSLLFTDPKMPITLAVDLPGGKISVSIEHLSVNAYRVQCAFPEQQYDWTYNNGIVSDGKRAGFDCQRVMVNHYRLSHPDDELLRLSTLKAREYPAYQALVRQLQLLNPDITGLEIMTFAREPAIHGLLQNHKPYPMPWFGDGLQMLFSILLAIFTAPGGVVFIDEFESSIHYSILEKVWNIISEAAREKDCQLFVATHSKECISAAAVGIAKEMSMQYIRLDKVGDASVDPVVYSREDLQNADAYDFEVR